MTIWYRYYKIIFKLPNICRLYAWEDILKNLALSEEYFHHLLSKRNTSVLCFVFVNYWLFACNLGVIVT